MTTWFYRGVGQMTMFDNDGGGGVKISKNLATWYMDAPRAKVLKIVFMKIGHL